MLTLSPALWLTICVVVLHPRHKLEYFKRMRWPEPWRKQAEELFIEEYNKHYKGRFNPNSDDELELKSLPGTTPPASRTASMHGSDADEDEDAWLDEPAGNDVDEDVDMVRVF